MKLYFPYPLVLFVFCFVPLACTATVGRRSRSSSSKSGSKRLRASNDDPTILHNCADFCVNDHNAWSDDAEFHQASSFSTNDNNRRCCHGGLSALKMEYRGLSSAEFFTDIRSLESTTANIRVVPPCGGAASQSESTYDRLPQAVFVDCASCFPDVTAEGCKSGATNATVNPGQMLCLGGRGNGVLPTNVTLFHRNLSRESNCPIFAVNLQTSCSRLMFPPFALLVGGECDSNDNSLVNLDTTAHPMSSKSYLKFTDVIGTQNGGIFLSSCLEGNSQNGRENGKCCRDGASFLKVRFYGGLQNVSGTLTFAAPNFECASRHRVLSSRRRKKTSESKKAPPESKSSPSPSSKTRSMSGSSTSSKGGSSKGTPSSCSTRSSSSSSKIAISSLTATSSKSSFREPTQAVSVAFVDCNSDCIATTAMHENMRAFRRRQMETCGTLETERSVASGATVCLAALNDSGVSLQSKMPSILTLYLTPDDQSAHGCVHKIVIETSCTRPIGPPFSQKFVDACEKENPPPNIRTGKGTLELYLDFVDGYSVLDAGSSALGQRLSFASCGCDCRVGQNFVYKSEFPSVAPSSSPSIEANEVDKPATYVPYLEPSCKQTETTNLPSSGTSVPTSEPSLSVSSSSEPSNLLPTPITLEPQHALSHEPAPLLSKDPTALVSTEPNCSPITSVPSDYPTTVTVAGPSKNPNENQSSQPSLVFSNFPNALASPSPTSFAHKGSSEPTRTSSSPSKSPSSRPRFLPVQYASETPTTSLTSKEPSENKGTTFWPSTPREIVRPSDTPANLLSSAPSPTMTRGSAAPTKFSRVPQNLDSPAPNPIAFSYSPSAKEVEESVAPNVSLVPHCEDTCGGWIQKECVMIDTKGHSTDQPCVIGDEWTFLLERFVSFGLPIDEQIHRRNLVIAALETSKAQIAAGLQNG